ncbi:hypothetical protein AWB67_06107 [Caballeronia terrestris]|uniref:EpsG family protein n=1 Tax=Caballeronia terrestris TaxID=1226301 RepID=A0A158KPM9_9BURK|nr:hypothetical protein [Caballeronia terrestris]SAL82381.1 hypothetical protein AWB67_06107 [Caballeronia terrestris]
MRNLEIRKFSSLNESNPHHMLTPSGCAFVLIASYVIWFLVTADRMSLPDQQPYLDYFRYTDWPWLIQYFQNRTTVINLFTGIFTDELGWRVWILLVNSCGFTPDDAVKLTVALTNGLVFIALARLRRPLLGLFLWIIIPAGLSIIGVFLVRQGFAFAVAMTFAIGMRRPILGMLIASTIHTTFAVPATLLIAVRMSGPRNEFAVPMVAVAGAILASSAEMLFANFGGRRVGDYAGYQAEFSVRLLVLMLSYSLASVLLLSSLKCIRSVNLRSVLRELALMQVGLLAYLIFAFTLFPFGKDRVFYLISLFLPFFLQEIRLRSTASLWMVLVLFSMVGAEVFLAYEKGTYVYFLK